MWKAPYRSDWAIAVGFGKSRLPDGAARHNGSVNAAGHQPGSALVLVSYAPPDADRVAFTNITRSTDTSGPTIPVPGINDPRGIAFADIDSDGDLDFAIGCKRSGNQLISATTSRKAIG